MLGLSRVRVAKFILHKNGSYGLNKSIWIGPLSIWPTHLTSLGNICNSFFVERGGFGIVQGNLVVFFFWQFFLSNTVTFPLIQRGRQWCFVCTHSHCQHLALSKDLLPSATLREEMSCCRAATITSIFSMDYRAPAHMSLTSFITPMGKKHSW